ncbi:MFS transporter [Saccharopolyspora cebuensis]|uniref:MFS transporter n=1 Tax=Saccharopolyspora cebuensis TaxID=418759 RepID=UPI0031EF056B
MVLKGISDDGAPRGVRWAAGRAREARTALYLLVVLTAGAYLPSPLYPLYQREFGFSDLTMTLVYAMFALVSVPVLVLFGSLSDALGKRAVLRGGIALAAVGSACFAFAADPGWLLVGRAAQGLALGACTGAATALIAECADRRDRNRASVLASTAFVLGTAAGPSAAGLLAQHAPAPRVLPYALHAALLAIAWHRVAAVPGARSGRWRPELPRIPRGSRLRFTAAAGTGFLAWTAAGLFLAVIPAALGRAAGVDDLAVIGGVLAAVLLCSALTQPLVPRLGARRAQLAGLAGLAVGLAALAFTGGGSVPVTLLAAVATGLGHGLAYGGASAAIAADDRRGAVTSALYLAFYLGAGIPAVAVGLLAGRFPLTTATSWLSAAAVVLVPLVALAVLRTAVVGRPPATRPLVRTVLTEARTVVDARVRFLGGPRVEHHRAEHRRIGHRRIDRAPAAPVPHRRHPGAAHVRTAPAPQRPREDVAAGV